MGRLFPGVSSFARYLLTFALDFAHGALMMSGVLVVVFGVYQAASYGLQGLNPRTMFGGVGARHSRTPAEEVVPILHTRGESSLDSSQVRVSATISRRYRLSPLVADELVRVVEREGRTDGVDPLLILSVISVESGFNPFAESALGAQGLMQVVPRYNSERLASADEATGSLFDPVSNIRIGTQSLKSFLASSASLETALQRYGSSTGVTDVGFVSRVLQEHERLRQAAGQQAGGRGAVAGAGVRVPNG